MKTLLKLVGFIVVCLIVALGVLRATGLPPHDRRPGLWLKGELRQDWLTSNASGAAYDSTSVLLTLRLQR